MPSPAKIKSNYINKGLPAVYQLLVLCITLLHDIIFYLTQSPLGLKNRQALISLPASKVIPQVCAEKQLKDRWRVRSQLTSISSSLLLGFLSEQTPRAKIML